MPTSTIGYLRRLFCVLALLGPAAHMAHAEDFFVGSVARTVERGEHVPADSTIGGYAIFQWEHQWRFLQSKVHGPTTMGVTYGSVELVQVDRNQVMARMLVIANLNESTRPFYMSNDPCSGEHLYQRNTLSADRGDASWGNCLTLGTEVVPGAGGPVTMLAVKVTNTQSASRYYSMHILIDPKAHGFPGTAPGDWAKASLAGNPERRKFLDGMVVWGGQLQDAVKDAIGYAKPKDAFSKVAPLRELVVHSAEADIKLAGR